MSSFFGIKNLPYKMVKMYDTSRKGSFMLQGQMTKNVRKKGKFSIILREDDSNQCSYKINRHLFDTLKKYLEPFRSYQAKPRKIRCIETGQIFIQQGKPVIGLKQTENCILRYEFNQTNLQGQTKNFLWLSLGIC